MYAIIGQVILAVGTVLYRDLLLSVYGPGGKGKERANIKVFLAEKEKLFL
jgi:hypothetical protein